MSRFSIVLIPDIMQGFGWRRGQRLMETWFSRPAAVAPHYSKPVTDVITMDWVLSFDRARKVYNKLMAEQIWNNAAGRMEIAKMGCASFTWVGLTASTAPAEPSDRRGGGSPRAGLGGALPGPSPVRPPRIHPSNGRTPFTPSES